MQITEVIVDKNRRELITRGTPLFPCAVYFSDITKYITGDIPWHWHEEIELVVVHSGMMYVNFGETGITLRKGEGIFINTNILHSMRIVGKEGCHLITIVFHSKIISGPQDSIFEQRYVNPLLTCQSLSFVHLSPGTEWQNNIILCILKAYTIYTEDDFGYEILVRDHLSKAWYYLVKNLQSDITRHYLKENHDTERIKKMLDFIHNNYSDQINLQQIADAANISERECFRCFERSIGMSPTVYLLKHRVSIAAKYLINTNMSVTEISSLSGFNTPSYFSKVFKNFMLCSPVTYRNKNE
ncbi:AraC family transcriptional regulator [Anaerocolumna sp. MB42-C2]|uniref:AraC family transcriptional regulator n=1 Tax=Anaerocolumna sp. MB42-C2 TaxID=3070997 RepID=UPI0027DFAB12|nr:AraC family transcriptional regulator [Anaerocolumna sp. MB42-C2]WMJ86998.1 AraC family transcriptional regulator [Anaerocolumna sp. MB42-C2]